VLKINVEVSVHVCKTHSKSKVIDMPSRRVLFLRKVSDEPKLTACLRFDILIFQQ
jgi:hypothetical protein